MVSPRFESTSWFGREVIGKAQRPWGGLLDGMNADGLVASLTAGGGAALGEGFSIILVLRYVLETCASVAEGGAVLRRLPVAQSQNVTLLHANGDFATVFLGPGRAAAVSRQPVCASHQESAAETPDSLRRATAAVAALAEGGTMLERVAARFLEPPLLVRAAAWRTVYSAIYRPAAGEVAYHWPGHCVKQRIGAFRPGQHEQDYGAETQRS